MSEKRHKQAQPPSTSAPLPRDMLFNVLYGSDHALLRRIIAVSAQRVEEYTGTNTVYRLAASADASLQNAQVVIIVLLHIDERLRSEFSEGRFAERELRHVCFEPMCAHKTASLYSTMRMHVLNPWVKHEANTPYSLIQAMRSEYLAS